MKFSEKSGALRNTVFAVCWLAMSPAIERVVAQESGEDTPGRRSAQDTMDGSVVGSQNGWFVKDDRVIWGNCQHNGWWSINIPSLVRKGDEEGPNRTEVIPALVDNMIRHGYPCFEHTPPLWHDRRRDQHDLECRTDDEIEGPTLEFPWARSGEGQACDGGSLYDLTKFDPWYFERLTEMAEESQRRGTVFIVNLYMQHALLKNHAHYLDFPWRPQNTVQDTALPEYMPAANAFYSSRMDLHALYINKVLDTLKPYPGTLVSLSGEYTGPLVFMEFFIDTVRAWELENDHDVRISLGATRDVLDAILSDPDRSRLVDVLDLRYFWYHEDGTMFDPPGGTEMIGDYVMGEWSYDNTPDHLYKVTREYRDTYPELPIIDQLEADRLQTIAFLMAGGSALVRFMQYGDTPESFHPPPDDYIAPPDASIIEPVYKLINTHLASILPLMRPVDIISASSETTWALGTHEPDEAAYLVYNQGGEFNANFRLGVKRLRWFDADTGELISSKLNSQPQLSAPGDGHYFLIAD
jgi:hypothetical protein